MLPVSASSFSYTLPTATQEMVVQFSHCNYLLIPCINSSPCQFIRGFPISCCSFFLCRGAWKDPIGCFHFLQKRVAQYPFPLPNILQISACYFFLWVCLVAHWLWLMHSLPRAAVPGDAEILCCFWCAALLLASMSILPVERVHRQHRGIPAPMQDRYFLREEFSWYHDRWTIAPGIAPIERTDQSRSR